MLKLPTHSGFHDLFLKQPSTKHTHKTKDQVTRTPLKTGDELRCSGREAVAAPLVAPVMLI